MKKIAILFTLSLLAFAGVALGAPNFVDNNLPLPTTKTDRIPVTNPTQQWGASDANTVFNALADIRTVLQRDPQVVFNVKAFGATGGGSVDDSAAINAAIAAAAVTVNGVYGGIVYLPKGTYRIGTPLVIPNGVGLRGDNPANTIIRASNAFNSTALIRNTSQNGTQEYAFLESLQIDGNKGGGAVCSEAVVQFGSLFINSFIRDVVILNGSSVGLHIFADGSPGGTGPVLIENTWVLHSGSHNVFLEDKLTNNGAFAGIVFMNLTSEHQGNNSSAIYLKGNGRLGQTNFYNTHIEQGGGETGLTGIKIDGASHILFDGVQLQTGDPGDITAGISITNVVQNVGIQIRGVTNINLINPVLSDAKNSVTVAAVNLPIYFTPDIVWPGLPVSPVNGKSLTVKDSSATSRAWFDTNGRLTGSGLFGGAVEILSNPQGTPGASDARGWMVMNYDATNPFGVYYPNGGGGALRERMFSSGQDVRQIDTNGNVFNYQQHTFQSRVTIQNKLVSNGNVPVLSSCGTGPTVLTGSTDTAGTFTIGSGATACTITFTSAFPVAPTCIVQASAQPVPTYTTSTTAISLTVGVASTTYNYICVGH